jgi:hypothetical protein
MSVTINNNEYFLSINWVEEQYKHLPSFVKEFKTHYPDGFIYKPHDVFQAGLISSSFLEGLEVAIYKALLPPQQIRLNLPYQNGRGLAFATVEVADCATAISGPYGISIVPENGTAITSYRGKASAGKHGMIIFNCYDFSSKRTRIIVGYIGETLDINGNLLMPNVFYCLTEDKQMKTKQF